MFFSTAVKQPIPTINTTSTPSSAQAPPIIQRKEQIDNPQPSTSSYQGKKKTQAFLQSPNSGRIYEEEIYVDAPPIQQQPTEQNSDISLEDDHSATLKIFNSSKNSHQSDSNSDRENYELQLKAAHKPRKKHKETASKRDGDRRKTQERPNHHRSRSHKGRKH